MNIGEGSFANNKTTSREVVLCNSTISVTLGAVHIAPEMLC